MGTGRAFHKIVPDIEKALDPVFVFIRGTTNLFEFVERRYFEHVGVRKPDTQVGCRLWFGKLLCIF